MMMSSIQQRRRRPQFNLKSLLLALLVAACFCTSLATVNRKLYETRIQLERQRALAEKYRQLATEATDRMLQMAQELPRQSASDTLSQQPTKAVQQQHEKMFRAVGDDSTSKH